MFTLKKRLATFTALSLVSLLQAAELPVDVQAVLKNRKETIKKIDEARNKSIEKADVTYLKQLKKLKEKYISKKDIKNATKIDNLITEVESTTFINSIVGPKWSWRHSGDDTSWFVLYANGTGSFVDHVPMTWELVKKGEVKATFAEGRSTIIKWNSSFKKYTALDFDKRTKVSGRLL